jgi:hypothetical protein
MTTKIINIKRGDVIKVRTVAGNDKYMMILTVDSTGHIVYRSEHGLDFQW